MGYPLSSKINLPKGLQLDARVRDFRLQDRWIILDIFGSLFPGIVRDIEHVTVAKGCKDEIIWCPCSTRLPRTKDFSEHMLKKGSIITGGQNLETRNSA